MSRQPFDRVVTEHGRTVLRVCSALLPPQDAEDAAADAFLAALEAYPRLRPGSDVRAWLVTIAHRKALDVLRRRARHAIPVAEIPERPDGAEPAVADDRLWRAVRALPDKQRHAVAYRYVADMAYSEVASIMGISEAAARRNAADGIRALRHDHPYSAEPHSTELPRDPEVTP